MEILADAKARRDRLHSFSVTHLCCTRPKSVWPAQIDPSRSSLALRFSFCSASRFICSLICEYFLNTLASPCGGTGRSPITATGSGRDVRLIRQWHRRSGTSPKVTAGALILIWRNSSIEVAGLASRALPQATNNRKALSRGCELESNITENPSFPQRDNISLRRITNHQPLTTSVTNPPSRTGAPVRNPATPTDDRQVTTLQQRVLA